MTDTELLERLRECLRYSPETGKFIWLMKPSTNANRVRVGGEAGRTNAHGYRIIGFRGKMFYAHRLAWFMTHGRWPIDMIDHANGDKADNRLCNLRECTNSGNQQNRRVDRDSRGGLPGITWDRQKRRWLAQITAAGKHRHLGRFKTKEEAHQAYLDAKANLHTFNPTPRW